MCTQTLSTNAAVAKAVQKMVAENAEFTAVTIRKALPKSDRSTLPQIGLALSKLFSAGKMGQGYSCIVIFDNHGQKAFKLYHFTQLDSEYNEGRFMRLSMNAKPLPDFDQADAEDFSEDLSSAESEDLLDRIEDSALNETNDDLNSDIDCSVEVNPDEEPDEETPVEERLRSLGVEKK
jgi:hypothetical protein